MKKKLKLNKLTKEEKRMIIGGKGDAFFPCYCACDFSIQFSFVCDTAMNASPIRIIEK